MSKVGTKFPDIAVKTINSDGDELNLNLSKPRRPTFYFGTQKILLLYVQQSYMLFKKNLKSLIKEVTKYLVLHVIV